MADNYISDKVKIRTNGTVYDAEITKPGSNFRLAFDGTNYTIRALSRVSFEIRNFPNSGEHMEMTEDPKISDNNKRIFWNHDKTVKVIIR